ncbi:Uncharacterised protein [Salmonella enterica subsp. enterica serovar Typhi]|nr:Uncharacterised protein [Salmonella enterica subsp. enterica serovar Typhi]CGW59359.1 Uncharacterised protein [Salmonella enterica subsp. enterica serovar Typhi]CGY16682.1 Uncharacterised protein [Salmonella enterica subsp. enterica serovar Typhi]CGY20032.1 Uncharacterised protein [Salmonella enterica subsp. enterica serovar Typhi]CGZ17057.1 Uncharacterised protein [Salmonella enterica subsp. enterica serovar Typhi]
MSLRVARRLRQRLPFIIQKNDLNSRLRRAVFQALRKDIQPTMVTVRGHADIAKGKQRSGITIVVVSSLIHYRHIYARLLQRLNIA